MKYIVVLGGVMSSVGKGITASSIGVLIQENSLKVTCIKIDPYLNCDAGTMSPLQHGEVFVLDDGGEVDLDLGNYERFLDKDLTFDNSITTGKIYKNVIKKERRGHFLGQTVQIVPHVTNEILQQIRSVSEDSDVCIIELGGTVGDIESQPFLYALKELSMSKDDEVLFVLVTFIPVVKYGEGSSEQKTKPTQHTVQTLHCASIWPNFIICRCEAPVTSETREKIHKHCHVPLEYIISCSNVTPVYRVVELFQKQSLDIHILQKFGFMRVKSDRWNDRIESILRITDGQFEHEINVAIIGKYTGKPDTYISVAKALLHAGAREKCKVNLHYTTLVEKTDNINAILVPGGFGNRGFQSKIYAVLEARKRKLPFLGICLGLQAMVVAAVRSELHWEDANSSEFDPETEHPVVDVMPRYDGSQEKGGTMRLGGTKILLEEDTELQKLYGKLEAYERHRHRYEVNTEKYREDFKKAGLKVVAHSPEGRVEAIEWKLDNIFFLGTQYHPEFLSRPGNPSAPFIGLIKSAILLNGTSD
jgi:CTP synthase